MTRSKMGEWYTDSLMEPVSLYFHIPFCAHRCSYCDFNTYAGLQSLIPDYVKAICREIQFLAIGAGTHLPVHTIYFGGGTPSLLKTVDIERILDNCIQVFDLQPGLEFTLEANPGTLSKSYLQDIRSLGVNRLSLGVQSIHPSELRLLERIHSYPDVIRSFTWARQAGIENINLDLIFGLPDQQIESWAQSIEIICGLKPEHLSLYSLTIENETPLGNWAGRGLLPLPDQDLAADMYNLAMDMLDREGYIHYEISNWALRSDNDTIDGSNSPVHSCRHNLQYWFNNTYLGLGAGAHGYANSTRYENISHPTVYIHHMSSAHRNMKQFPHTPAVQASYAVDAPTEIGETMMMGLRLLREGISAKGFKNRFGVSLLEYFKKQIKDLEGSELIELVETNDDTLLRLSKRGYLLGNRVFAAFI